MVLIDKAALLNKIATEVHYDSEHSLEMYAKMLSLINDAPDGVVQCKDCRHAGECHKSVQYSHNESNTVTIGYTPIEWCSRGERREDGKAD